MDSVKYIGMDVHQETISIAVRTGTACAFSSIRIDSTCERWENISSIHVAL
jgi:hypothetical protein